MLVAVLDLAGRAKKNRLLQNNACTNLLNLVMLSAASLGTHAVSTTFPIPNGITLTTILALFGTAFRGLARLTHGMKSQLFASGSTQVELARATKNWFQTRTLALIRMRR